MTTVCEGGVAEMLKSNVGAEVTSSVTVVVLVRPPPMPDMVKVKEPVGVVAAAETVRVDVNVGLPDAGSNEIVAPEGRPETLKVTVCVVPLRRLTETEYVVDWPCATLLEEGDAVTSKLNVGAEAIDRCAQLSGL